MAEDIYAKLREKIDRYSVGMGATESGKEIKILKRLFTENEAKVYIGMTRSLESAKTISSRVGMETAEVKSHLDSMTDKGLTFPKTKDGVRYYAAAPFMHGFFEHQVFRKVKDPEIPALFEDYIMGGFIPKTTSMRTVPVMAEVDAKDTVLPYDDVREIIKSKERIGLFGCACNYQVKQMGSQCVRPGDVCIAFDFYAEYVIEEMKFGRWITQAEALEIVEKAEKDGLVHQTAGDIRNTEAICNCCPDCCTVLRRLKLLPKPALLKNTNYRLEHEDSKCISCMTCLDRCPMKALTYESDRIQVNRDRCIGCGLCTTTCASGAMMLVKKAEGDIKPPPEKYEFMRSTIDLYKELESESKN
jgi:Fe-S-cluster-containing hydrogenase component 2